MAGAESSPDRLVILGGPQVVEAVIPVADEFELQTTVHETIKATCSELGATGDGVVGVVIDVDGYKRVPGDHTIDYLVTGLKGVFEPPIPFALIAGPDNFGRLSHRYDLGDQFEARTAIPWPPEAALVRSWLEMAIRSRRDQ